MGTNSVISLTSQHATGGTQGTEQTRNLMNADDRVRRTNTAYRNALGKAQRDQDLERRFAEIRDQKIRALNLDTPREGWDRNQHTTEALLDAVMATLKRDADASALRLQLARERATAAQESRKQVSG